MFLRNLERRFGKYAIYNLPIYIVATCIIGFILENVSGDIYGLLLFNPYYILHGQVWRIITWVLTIPYNTNILFFAIMAYFYYSIGMTLERTWGAFKFNIYIFSGIIFTAIGGIIMYVVCYLIFSSTGDVSVIGNFFGVQASYLSESNVMYVAGYGIGSAVSTYYIYMSMLLAFAVTYPDAPVMLYYIIPVKVKWLGILYALIMLADILSASWGMRIIMIISILNFLLFLVVSKDRLIISPAEVRRKSNFRKKVRQAQVNSTHNNGARHKCFVCGCTELDNPDLTFRFCSKCTGGKEYCQNHLFTHTHK